MRVFPSKRADVQLIVRAQRPDDWQALYDIREQSGVRPNVLALPFENPEDTRERVMHHTPSGRRLVAEARLSDGTTLIVGNLGLFQDTLSGAERASLGIQIHEDYQEIGVGSALMTSICDLADNWLNLHRIDLDVFTDNVRAIALYQKFGFEIEATARRFAFRNGEYFDAYVMGRINPHHTRAIASL